MLRTCLARNGRSVDLGQGARLLLMAMGLVGMSSTARAVNDGPQAYYFNAVGAFSENTANGAWWHYEAGKTISGVFIYDNRANPTTTEPIPNAGYVPVFPPDAAVAGYQQRYLEPSQTAFLRDTN